MTAISFKSDSGDDSLEVSNNESATVFIDRLVERYGTEWEYIHVVCIESTDYSDECIQGLINKSKEKY